MCELWAKWGSAFSLMMPRGYCVNSRASLPFFSHHRMCNLTRRLSAETWRKEKRVGFPRVWRCSSLRSQCLSSSLPSQWTAGGTVSVKEASSNRLLEQEREPRLPPWFVIQWTASLEKWIYWCALCRGIKVGPYLGDAICRAMQLLIRSFEKKRAEKHSYPFGIPVMERDEKREVEGLGGQRQSRPCGFFLSERCSTVSYRCFDNLPLFGGEMSRL